MAERTTIKDLARRSGVSIGTVSRALNGYRDVADETRRRVLALAEELDYTPQAAARTLARQRSQVIGVFLATGEGHPDLQHPFFLEVLVGVRDALADKGYDLLLFAGRSARPGYGSTSSLSRCRQHGVDGAVVMGVDPEDVELRQLARSDLPCVAVDVDLRGRRSLTVTSDNAAGAQAAVAHLHGLGHTRIATVAGPLDTRPARDRLRGFRHGITEAGLAYRDELVTYGDFYVESGYRAGRRLLALAEPPTAVVVASDLMAVGVYRAAREEGRRVPEDLSVVGFDDIAAAEHLHPGLTTVRQDKSGLGRAAASALLNRVERGDGRDAGGRDGEVDDDDDGEDDRQEVVTLPVELVVRGSTAVPRG